MIIAIDTETELITADEPVPRLVSVAIATPGQSRLFLWSNPELPELLRSFWRSGSTTIFANAPFDLSVLRRQFPAMEPDILTALQHGLVRDVLTRSRLIDAGEGTHTRKISLASEAKRFLGVDLDKSADTWRMRYAELRDTPIGRWPAEAREYAEADAVVTLAVYLAQETKPAVYFDSQAEQARAHWALYQQHPVRGVKTDQAAVEALDRSLAKEAADLAPRLLDAGLLKVKSRKTGELGRDTKAIQKRMLEAADFLGVALPETSRGVSISEKALDLLRLPKTDPLMQVQRYGSIGTLRSKNIPPLRAPIVRTRYTEVLATGRTSSGGPNLQNLPRKGGFRECLVPRPGYRFVISDFSGFELVCLAQVQVDWFGQSTLGEVLRAGGDPHAQLAATILGREFDPEADGDTRQLAKAPNFGFPGGLGPARFVAFARGYDVHLSEAEARDLKHHWLRCWPEEQLRFNQIAAMADSDGLITIRSDRAKFIRGACTFTEACNFVFQALAAAAAKQALWDLETIGVPFGIRPVLFVHDEIVSEMPEDQAEALQAVQDQIMVAAANRFVPDIGTRVKSTIEDRYTK